MLVPNYRPYLDFTKFPIHVLFLFQDLIKGTMLHSVIMSLWSLLVQFFCLSYFFMIFQGVLARYFVEYVDCLMIFHV
jgi:hypothetical protein